MIGDWLERLPLHYKDGLTPRTVGAKDILIYTEFCQTCCGFKGPDVNGNFCGDCGGFGYVIRRCPR